MIRQKVYQLEQTQIKMKAECVCSSPYESRLPSRIIPFPRSILFCASPLPSPSSLGANQKKWPWLEGEGLPDVEISLRLTFLYSLSPQLRG